MNVWDVFDRNLKFSFGYMMGMDSWSYCVIWFIGVVVMMGKVTDLEILCMYRNSMIITKPVLTYVHCCALWVLEALRIPENYWEQPKSITN